MNLATWAEQCFNVVEQDGATTARVKLVQSSTGEVWHTWFPPFAAPLEWETLAESTLRGLEQHTSGKVQVTFVAESRSGEVLSQLPWRVNGKLVAGSLEGSAQASAAVIGAVGQTMERLTELVNRQLDSARKALELEMEQKLQLMEVVRAYRYRELDGEAPPPSPVVEMLQQYAPQLQGAAELLITVVQDRIQAAKAASAAAAVAPPAPPQYPAGKPPPQYPAGKRARRTVNV